MVMFLALYPIESISLNSFVLLEHLAILLTSILEINFQLRNFLNKAIKKFAKIIKKFAKPFLIFLTILNSKLDLNLSCAKDFRNLNSMVTWCIN